MGSDTQFVKQSVVVSQDELIPSRMHERIALFNADGTPLDLSPNDVAAYQAASVATTVAGTILAAAMNSATKRVRGSRYRSCGRPV